MSTRTKILLLRAALWPFIGLTVGAVGTLVAQAVGGALPVTENPFVAAALVGLGGWGLLMVHRATVTGTLSATTLERIRLALEGPNGDAGAVGDLRELRRRMDDHDGQRVRLNQSVSRIDGSVTDNRSRIERIEGYLDKEVGPALGRPFAYPPDTAFHPRREREAG